MLPRFELELSMPSLLLFILSLAFFIIVSQRDPGYARKKAGTSMIKLYEIHHFDSICPFCQIKRSSKTRHCQYCERCVAEYDHHCPWIRNCVGAGNFKIFIAFLFICCIDLAYMSTLGMLDYFEKLNHQYRIVEVKSYHKEMGLVVTGICFSGFCIAFPVLVLQLHNICKNKNTKIEPDYKNLKSASNKESTFSLIPEEEQAGCCTKRKSLELTNK